MIMWCMTIILTPQVVLIHNRKQEVVVCLEYLPSPSLKEQGKPDLSGKKSQLVH